MFSDKLVIQAIFGKHIQEALKANLDGYYELEEVLKKEFKDNGYITLPLGLRTYPDSNHKVINYANQTLGGIAMKQYLSIVYQSFLDANILPGRDFRLQAIIYDEVDLVCAPYVKDEIRDILNQSYKLTSRALDLNVHYSGETLVGHYDYDIVTNTVVKPSWSQCH